MRTASVILFLALFGLSHCGDGESQARLLVSKNILNQLVVQGKDLTVHYSIYNVGSSAAIGVTLSDESFPSGDFEVVQGLKSAKWRSIAPGTNVSHTLIMRPQKSGMFNFTAAQVTYKPSEDATDLQVAFSSAPGEGGVMSSTEYDRKHSPHLVDWGLFGLMCVPTIVIPLLMWYRSHAKYENFKAKKN